MQSPRVMRKSAITESDLMAQAGASNLCDGSAQLGGVRSLVSGISELGCFKLNRKF